MKTVAKVAMVVGIAALAVVTAGAALGVAAGATLATSASFAVATVAEALGVSGALVVGAALVGAVSVASMLEKKPQASPAQTNRLHASLVPDTARKFVFGHTAFAADMRYEEWWGLQQELCGQIFVLASHYIESLDEIWLNDELAWTKEGGTQGRYVNYFFCSVRERATPDNAYVDTWSNRWSTNAPLTGCADAFIRFRIVGISKGAESPFSSGIPTRITFRGRAALFYDPRFDSTRGGSGSMRLDDQSTWAYQTGDVVHGRNLPIAFLNWLIGWRIQNPVTHAWKVAVGCAVEAEDLDFDSFITAANMADELVYKADGTQEPRYCGDGIFSDSDSPQQVIAAFEAHMNGKLRDTGGKLTLQLFHDDLSVPVLDFTDDDVLGNCKWSGGGALHDRKNIVRGKYTDASDNSLYQPVDYPSVSTPSLDGRDRFDPVDYLLCQSPDQAQRLAKMRIERSLYAGTWSADYNAKAWAVKDGDVVRQTLTRMGWNLKPFRVALGTVDLTGRCPVTLIEENAAIYANYSDVRPAITAAAPNTFDPLLLPIPQAILELDGRIAAIASDNVLAAGEKPQVVRDWNALYQNYTALNDKATALDIASSERGDAAAKVGALAAYLTGLSPSWTDTDHDTPIVSATLQGKWSDATASIAALQAAIQGLPGPPGADGISPRFHLAYSDSSDGSVNFTTGAPGSRGFIGTLVDTTIADSTDHTAYTWSRFLGLDGTDGTPGAPGADGHPSYIHFAYANSADGAADFTNGAPGSRTYIGVYADQTLADSGDHTLYSWSLIKGDKGDKGDPGVDGTDGLPGAPGADGVSARFHLAYADSADGTTNFTTGAPGSRKYIGTRVDTTVADSSSPSDYTWSRYVGLDGNDGTPGAPGANGQPSYIHFAYADSADGATNFTTGAPGSRTYIGVYADQTLADSTDHTLYSWSLIKGDKGDKGDQGNPGVDGTNGLPGAPGADGVSPRFHLAYSNSADGTADFTTGAPGSRTYIGVRVDTTVADSIVPSEYTWSRYVGLDGDNGTPGAPGSDGSPSYVHFAYANSSDGSSGFTTGASGGRTYIGVYSDHTLADSTDHTAYAWSLIRGADGSNGSNGTNGSNGSDGVNALSTSAVPAVFTIACTNDGSVKSGEFNKASQLHVLFGSTDETSAASYSASTTNCSASVDSSGLVTITAISGDHAYVDITVTYSSISRVQRITLDKVRDGATPSGSGAPITVDLGDTITVSIPDGGSVSVSANAFYSGATPGGAIELTNKYRPVGGSWTSLTTHTGSEAAPGENMRCGTGTESVPNTSGHDQRFEITTDISGEGGTVNEARTYTSVTA